MKLSREERSSIFLIKEEIGKNLNYTVLDLVLMGLNSKIGHRMLLKDSRTLALRHEAAKRWLFPAPVLDPNSVKECICVEVVNLICEEQWIDGGIEADASMTVSKQKWMKKWIEIDQIRNNTLDPTVGLLVSDVEEPVLKREVRTS